MIIKVENAKLTIDGKEMKTADLSQELLDKVVSESLQGSVEYQLEGDHPLVKFFQTLHDGTKEGSALRQKMNEMESARKAAEAGSPEKTEDGEPDDQGCGDEPPDGSSQ